MKSIIDTLSVIKDAVTRFNKDSAHSASIALIGGYAAVYFGSERTTFDIDYVFTPKIRNLAALSSISSSNTFH